MMEDTEGQTTTPWKAIVSWIVFFTLFMYSGAQVNSAFQNLDKIADPDNFLYFVLHFISYYIRVYIQFIIILIIVLLFVYTMYMMSDAITNFEFFEKGLWSNLVLHLMGGVLAINNSPPERKGMIHFIKSVIDPTNFFITLREDIITCHYRPFFIGLIMALFIAVVIWFIYKRKLKRIESDDTYQGEDEHDNGNKEKEVYKHQFLLLCFRNGLTFTLITVICVYLYAVFQSMKK